MVFPSSGSVSRRSPSLRRVPRGGSPASSVLSERSDSPAPVPLRFVAFAQQYRGDVRPSLSQVAGRRAPVSRDHNRRWPIRLVFRGDDGVSQVPGCALVFVPCSQTPEGSRRLASDDASMRPSACITASAPSIRYFEAQSHGPSTRCLRFAGWVAPPPRKTRFRLAASLYRAGLSPCWAH
jgi:hypothetical protein